MTNYIIETKCLSKTYYLKRKKIAIPALNNVNISIKKGEIFGLLGPNGSGKTTLIQILTTLIRPTNGTAIIDGFNILKNPKKAKNKIALMLDWRMFYPTLSGYNNLVFFAKIYNVKNYKKKIYDVAKELGLEKSLDQPMRTFSTGMFMKLALCRTLVLNRNILFLDEPTVGLDIHTKFYIVNKLKNLKGKTILLCSHDMDVIEKLCDRIAFIDNGKIIKVGTKEDLQRIEQQEIKIQIEIHKDRNLLKNELSKLEYIDSIVNNERGLIINLFDRKYYQNFLEILSKYIILSVSEKEKRLENLFLKIIKSK